MARNKIQFQRGLSETGFAELYGSEEQCRGALKQWRWPNGFICPECGATKSSFLAPRRLYQCAECGRQTSVTAGTIFHRTKLPLTTWFRAMYLMTQSKNGVSAMELMRRLDVNYDTAWKLKHKLAQVMLEREATRRLDERVEVDDAYLGGERPGKPGRGAEGKTRSSPRCRPIGKGARSAWCCIPCPASPANRSADSPSSGSRRRPTSTATGSAVSPPWSVTAVRIPPRSAAAGAPLQPTRHSSGSTRCSATSNRPWSAPIGIWTLAMPLATSPSSSTGSIVATTSPGCSRGSPTLPSAHRRCLATFSSSLRHVGNQVLPWAEVPHSGQR